MSSLEELKKYIEFLSSTDIEEIEICSQDGEKIFLKRERSSTGEIPVSKLLKDTKNLVDRGQSLKEDSLEVKKEEPPVEEFTVRSPMVGKFLLSVSQDHPPFIMEGSQVKQGQKIAVIETMRILREVVSPKEGIVKRILVKDGEFVEYGQPLIVLEIKQGER